MSESWSADSFIESTVGSIPIGAQMIHIRGAKLGSEERVEGTDNRLRWWIAAGAWREAIMCN